MKSLFSCLLLVCAADAEYGHLSLSCICSRRAKYLIQRWQDSFKHLLPISYLQLVAILLNCHVETARPAQLL